MTSGDTGYFKSEMWIILGDIEVIDSDLQFIDTDSEFNTFDIESSIEISVDSASSIPLIEEKWEYLEATSEDPVTEDEVLEAFVSDLETAISIIFNRVGYDAPDEGAYEKINDRQWRQIESGDLYSRYQNLLWDITPDDGVPSIPGLRPEFLLRASESESHEVPPEGTVNEILSTHIEMVRKERSSRAGVSQVKLELERRGIDPRTAMSAAQSVESYMKTDAELEEIHSNN